MNIDNRNDEGFEAFETVLQLVEHRQQFKAFRIPMIVLPATISNNVPGNHLDASNITYTNMT